MLPTSAVADTATLFVSEVFGPVWQGEGRQAGQLCAFVRLSGCNLSCRWCDTPYTWAFTPARAAKHDSRQRYNIREERGKWEISTILAAVEGTKLVVISGGEPFTQLDSVNHLAWALLNEGHTVAFETAGTISPLPSMAWAIGSRAIQWVVSPKLPSAGNPTSLCYKPDVLRDFDYLGADFKFVISDETDMEEARRIVMELVIPRERVWCMPEGITATAALEGAKKIAPWVLEQGWNLTLRQHTLLYGNERGK